MNNDENRNRNIFYVVVAIATLIVAIVGATLAYFSVFASSNENAVSLKAKEVRIDYTDGQNILFDDIIPAAFTVVETSFLHPISDSTEGANDGRPICKDDQGYSICTATEFTITNSGSAADMEFYLDIGLNEFKNLRYMLYHKKDGVFKNVYRATAEGGLGILTSQTEKSFEVIQDIDLDNNDDTTVPLLGYSDPDPDNPVARKYHFDAGDEITFCLVMYLHDTDEDIIQNTEQGASFAGTIKVKFGDTITGRISRSGN